ncbi:NAD(P)H-dependent oxidoreductase [Bosea sp. F3-2]|uniref:NAD(P)H-dependent oxidoreductase n=1 Tax=Bosea sp. F3-2 TaxID=2599640 RepID=UPI0011F00E86|nr:NAD(P)H-dependent oxidoreductase [Bosea sp. F3-2]QEL25522.1 NAD(P)H-dependent oxidoreductase [Bosea sp. F3-2]
MKILYVFAHPEERSLNGSLREVAFAELRAQGHEILVSDLYAMGWKSQVDRQDFPQWPADKRLLVPAASKAGFASAALTADVEAEIAKLRAADGIILHFPLWWFSMPAILKGWVDRVFAYGYGYGVGEHSDARWGDRYGEGMFQDKRAMLVVTAGGWAPHYSARGINGPIDDLLFPIQHGVLFYPGAQVLPPYVLYQADRIDEARFASEAERLRARMRGFLTEAPIPYRRQNGGDYSIPGCELQPWLGGPDASGFALHSADASPVAARLSAVAG